MQDIYLISDSVSMFSGSRNAMTVTPMLDDRKKTRCIPTWKPFSSNYNNIGCTQHSHLIFDSALSFLRSHITILPTPDQSTIFFWKIIKSVSLQFWAFVNLFVPQHRQYIVEQCNSAEMQTHLKFIQPALQLHETICTTNEYGATGIPVGIDTKLPSFLLSISILWKVVWKECRQHWWEG
jgi:hypothetical protein